MNTQVVIVGRARTEADAIGSAAGARVQPASAGVEAFFADVLPRSGQAPAGWQPALQLVWAALEDAGIVPGTLAAGGHRAGVYLVPPPGSASGSDDGGSGIDDAAHDAHPTALADFVADVLGWTGPRTTLGPGQPVRDAVEAAAEALRGSACQIAIAGAAQGPVMVLRGRPAAVQAGDRLAGTAEALDVNDASVEITESMAAAESAGRTTGDIGSAQGIEHSAQTPPPFVAPLVPLVLSARTDSALADQARALLALLTADPDLSVRDLALSLATTRTTTFERRAVLLAADREDAERGLQSIAEGGFAPFVFRTPHGARAPGDGRAVHVFSGVGSLWTGMAVDLLDRSEVFRRRMRECDRALAAYVPWSLFDVLHGTPGAPAESVEVAQPVYFAIAVSLSAVWQECGVRPAAVVAASLGEFAAAHVAGALSLDDAMKIVVLWSRMQGAAAGEGELASARMSQAELLPWLDTDGRRGRVHFAGSNGPRAVLFSGERSAVLALVGALTDAGFRARTLSNRLPVHGPGLKTDSAPLLAGAATTTPVSSRVPFHSGLVGGPFDTAGLDGQYWYRNITSEIRFEQAVRGLVAEGRRTFLEISPHPAVLGAIQETLEDAGATDPADGPAGVVDTLRRDQDSATCLLTALSQLYALGGDADWGALFRGTDARRITLPTYPFAATGGETVRPDGAVDDGDVRARFARLSESDQRRWTDQLVRAQIAALLGRSEVTPGASFKELGFDSVTGITLRNRLVEATGLDLPATLIFDRPRYADLVDHLSGVLAGTADDAPEQDETRPRGDDEPVAIVGMACRFPGGVDSPESLWRLVSSGTDAISAFPVNRGWDLDALYDPDPDRAGASYVRDGGFLHDADQFDAAFFGISPREALAMDPQQRLMLETSWEALERAGIDPTRLRGSRTGVFIGAMTQDYGARMHEADDAVQGHVLTGTSVSVLSGRQAYFYGLEGPALTIDTACSSSLVALHQALQSLRRGESGVALAGGVAVMAAPGMFVEFARQRGLASDGRCKAFAAAADGTNWSEGVGVLVLERLSDARRNGHRVLALVRGSAINQDGASNGLTAPNGPSQQRVIRAALGDAGLTAADVDAVEAHGTGTALGDPIEAQALIATYGQDRPADRPLWLGSIKSNIGHAQAAAGVGGVIKMVLAMRHGILPKTLHVTEPTTHVDWSAGTVRLLTEQRSWADLDRPRRAAVSSFGISGTNAHVILEQAPEDPADADPAEDVPIVPLVLSARTDDALRASAERLRTAVTEHPGWSPAALSHALLTQRALHDHRAVVLGADRDELLAGLESLAAGSESPNVITGSGTAERPVFVFPGQGAQWTGMAKELLATSPVFAAAIAECEVALSPYVTWSLTEVLADGEPITGVEAIQPALFAMMIALARVWQSLGVEPAAVIGHSQGEIAAAVIAGALSLDDGAKVVALRSQALTAITGQGGMASIPYGPDETTELLAPWQGRLSIATLNSPEITVVAGDTDALDELLVQCDQDNIQARRVSVDYASHSEHIEPLRDGILEALEGIAPRTSEVPFYSAVTTATFDTAGLDAEYWYTNLRDPVRLSETTRAALTDGHTTFLEVSPHPVLTPALQQTAEATEHDALITGTLRRDEGGWRRLLTGAARLATRAVPLTWPTSRPRPHRHIDLPTYPFERRPYWLKAAATAGEVRSAGLDTGEHPLVGASVPVAGTDQLVLTSRLSPHTQPWLADHAVWGTVLAPGTALLDLAIHAADLAGCAAVAELALQAPVVLPDDDALRLQITIEGPDQSGHRPLSIHTRAEQASPDTPWTCHATGLLTPAAPTGDSARTDEAWPPPGATPVSTDELYPRLADIGYHYGPAFQGLRALWRSDEELFAEVRLPEHLHDEAPRYGIHPALLDAALHAFLIEDLEEVRLPFSWTDITLHATGATALRVRLRRCAGDGISLVATDPYGQPVVEVGCLVSRPVNARQLASAGSTAPGGLLHLEWVEAALPEAPAAAPPRVWGDDRLGLDLPVCPDLDAAEAGDTLILACAPASHDGQDVPEDVRAALHEVLARVQEWLADERFAAGRLVVVTQGAVAAGPGETVTDLIHAPVWGLVRTAQSEHPDRFVLADLDPHPDSRTALPRALTGGEPQLALRGGALTVPRLTPTASDQVLVPPADASAWRLDTTGKGTLDNLALIPAPEAAEPLASGQVRIAVRAAGINFRDILLALDMVDQSGMGGEAAGTVVEVASDVTGFSVGDRVMGMVPGSFGPIAVTDQRLLIPLPEGWTHTQGATTPIVFLTAYHSLVHLADLRAGQSVLIHAATGGVGLAALQIARHLGADVHVTASPAKQHLLRALGVPEDRISSSRTLDFEDRVRNATDGRGVDVVLNSLAREYIDASFRVTASSGRFVEIGKTDIRDPAQVTADHPGVTYHWFDLLQAEPDHVERLFAQITPYFTDGTLRPLPTTTWDIRHAPQALRHISQARHTGKLALTMPPASPDPDGTVLITGGTGTLGALLARHLIAENGVRHLLLVSRQGMNAPGAAELRDELAGQGADVTIAACDTTDHDQLAALIAGVPAEHPLTAVVHAAGVLDDTTISTLTPARLDTVLTPKIDTAWNLHRLTQDTDLPQFTLYSSTAALTGAAGQANYAAANTFLDALARHRHATGLPTTSIGWGLWETTSTMTGHLSQTDHSRLQRSGVTPLTDAQGLALYDAAVTTPHPHQAALQVSPEVLTRSAAEVPALLRGLIRPATRRAAVQETGPEQEVDLRDRLKKLTPEDRGRTLLDIVRRHTAAVLGHADPHRVEPKRGFQDMGVDSLTSLELRNRLGAEAGLRLPTTLIFDCPSPVAAVAYLEAQLLPEMVAEEQAGEGSGVHPVDQLDESAFRQALESIPLERFRAAGLVDIVLRLAEEQPSEPEAAGDNGSALDSMDLEGLVRVALGGGG